MSRLFPKTDHRGLLAPLNDQPYSAASDESAWDDQQGSASQALQGASALTLDVYRDTPARIQCMRHDQNDDVTFWYQYTHRWAKNDVRPHIHLKPLANGSGNVRITGIYAWTTKGLPLPALSGWTPFTIDVPITAADLYGEVIASLGAITPPLLARIESAWLVFQFQRAGTDPNDTYTASKDHGLAAANIGLMGADVHFLVEKLGTKDPFPGG